MPNELTPEMIEELERLLASPDVGPFPWLHSEDEPGQIDTDELDGQRHSIGGFWGGCTEWVDRSALVVFLVNNATALLSAARSNAQVREREEELAHLQDCLGMAQTGPDACVTVRASALGHVLRSADPDYARGVEIAKRSAGAFREALERSAAESEPPYPPEGSQRERVAKVLLDTLKIAEIHLTIDQPPQLTWNIGEVVDAIISTPTADRVGVAAGYHEFALERAADELRRATGRSDLDHRELALRVLAAYQENCGDWQPTAAPSPPEAGS